VHLTAPAIHLTEEGIVKLMRSVDFELENPEANSIVRLITAFLREKILKAEVGFTGANTIAADAGSLVIIENEGNEAGQQFTELACGGYWSGENSPIFAGLRLRRLRGGMLAMGCPRI